MIRELIALIRGYSNKEVFQMKYENKNASYIFLNNLKSLESHRIKLSINAFIFSFSFCHAILY